MYVHVHASKRAVNDKINVQVVDFVVVSVSDVKESHNLLHAVPEHSLQLLRRKPHRHDVGFDIWEAWVREQTGPQQLFIVIVNCIIQ